MVFYHIDNKHANFAVVQKVGESRILLPRFSSRFAPAGDAWPHTALCLSPTAGFRQAVPPNAPTSPARITRLMAAAHRLHSRPVKFPGLKPGGVLETLAAPSAVLASWVHALARHAAAVPRATSLPLCGGRSAVRRRPSSCIRQAYALRSRRIAVSQSSQNSRSRAAAGGPPMRVAGHASEAGAWDRASTPG